ncbi:hypothetical protein E2C01_097672 [Portunus trituberculatus]|uniref:Uncharacterized protein n=1 Tax=Portunus trituberculatus TaxID=210409 RepID=A0A5B7KC05_PORTR|nr:hypothetical protein [Portunus trituberculatus]
MSCTIPRKRTSWPPRKLSSVVSFSHGICPGD